MCIENFENRARGYAEALPGIIRATLMDHGVSSTVVDDRLIGWDGNYITVPVRGRAGRIVFFERWDAAGIGKPVDDLEYVELFGWDVLERKPSRLVIAEGIHEALSTAVEKGEIAAI
ncbi:MAG: hypothetical protein IH936_04910 [Acidobacteria bacterium]|nr:hypothetical protein [Acidobacteriota bacterium]